MGVDGSFNYFMCILGLSREANRTVDNESQILWEKELQMKKAGRDHHVSCGAGFELKVSKRIYYAVSQHALWISMHLWCYEPVWSQGYKSVWITMYLWFSNHSMNSRLCKRLSINDSIDRLESLWGMVTKGWLPRVPYGVRPVSLCNKHCASLGFQPQNTEGRPYVILCGLYTFLITNY